MDRNAILALLAEGRRRELAQTRFYRSLAGQAETDGRREVAERLNALLADEQHHVSRLTARILELGSRPASSEGEAPAAPTDLEGWEEVARGREQEEIRWYRSAVDRIGDDDTKAVLEEILEAELHHERGLEGKWMPAAPERDAERA